MRKIFSVLIILICIAEGYAQPKIVSDGDYRAFMNDYYKKQDQSMVPLSSQLGLDVADVMNEVFSQISRSKTEAEEMHNKRLSLICNSMLPQLKNKITNDQDAKFSMAALVLWDKRILNFNTYFKYSEEQALEDMYMLAQKGYPNAQFLLGSLFAKTGFQKGADDLMQALSKTLNPATYADNKNFFSENEAYIAFKSNPTNENKKRYSMLLDSISDYSVETGDHETLTQVYETLIADKFVDAKQFLSYGAAKGNIPVYYIVKKKLASPSGSNYSGSSFVEIDKEAVTELQKGILKKEKKKQNASGDYKLLGDIFCPYPQLVFGRRSVINMPDSIKSFNYYNKAAEGGNIDSEFWISLFYQKGIGTEKDPKLGFEKLLTLANKGYIPAYTELAKCYELGVGTEINHQEALRYYKLGMNGKDKYDAFGGICRLSFKDVKNLSPLILDNMYPSEFRKELAKDKSKVKILHFWNQGLDSSMYNKTMLLLNSFGNNQQNIKLYFGSLDHSFSPKLAEAMGYRGIIYDFHSYNTDNPSNLAYNKKMLGFENSQFAKAILKVKGNIHPMFDERWINVGMPATFVYVEGEDEPAYFDGNTPTSTIISFVKSKSTK